VQASLVRSRKNLITGQIVIADVVLRQDLDGAGAIGGSADAEREILRREILATCRQSLANYKVPAAIRFVAALELAATGKSVRT
jgi:acyl-coenzyme A synthetase/AMP-(fatty) acid ligase